MGRDRQETRLIIAMIVCVLAQGVATVLLIFRL
jgi:hypothetical protein